MRKFLLCLFCICALWNTSVKGNDTLTKQEEDISQIEIYSDYAYLINLDERFVLYEKQSEDKMYPASMTKIMTVFTALDYITDLEERVTITDEMLEGLMEANASVAGFYVGETYTMRDLLYGIFLPSGADASRAVSLTIAKDEAEFVDRMNEKAASLGLKHTHFVNTSGLHDDHHYTTAKEMAVILEEALKNPIFYEIFTSSTYQTISTDLHPQGIIFTSSLRKGETQLGVSHDLITGGKTGFTNDAELCLASYFKNDNTSYIFVSGHAPSFISNAHIQDAHTIYNFANDHFLYTKVADFGRIISEVSIKDSWIRNIDITLKEDLSALVSKDMDISKVSITFQGQKIYRAPLDMDTKLGDIIVSYEGKELKKVPYLLEEDIHSSMIVKIWNYIIEHIFVIFLIIILMIGSYVIYIRKTYRKNKKRRKRRKLRRHLKKSRGR